MLPPPAAIVRLLRGLDLQARKEGGAVYMLQGNHETLNVCGDFRGAQTRCHPVQHAVPSCSAVTSEILIKSIMIGTVVKIVCTAFHPDLDSPCWHCSLGQLEGLLAHA
eukprot:929870-Pelagomonas_calceolata.AAC.6